VTTAELRTLALPIALALGGVLVGLLARRVVLGRLSALAQRTAKGMDDAVVAALRGPVVLWGAMLGLYLAMGVLVMSRAVQQLVQRTLLGLLVLSVSWVVAQLAAAAVRRRTVAGDAQLPAATLVTNLVRILVLATGVLVILQTLGISITPIITALGVGGLAVALALQDTLANLFAGVHILATRQIRPGDFIRLESGEEGYVQDVTWRNTTIRQLPNSLTIVPNAKLAAAVTTNYHLPDLAQSFLVAVGVSYDSDLTRVERVAVEVAREMLRNVPGGVADFEPFIRYHAFGDSSIDFNVILRAREVTDQHLLRHEFIKRLHTRFRQEGIEIPFPIRTVHMRSSDTEGTRRISAQS
jgi:small-conductance mechanosensitive channel